jgi:aminoglycoside N3'-acetyltransferase
MKVAVWDTYVEKEDGNIMHFDILVPDNITNEQTIFNLGKSYLKTKSFKTGQLTSNECRLCHIEQATEEIVLSIEKKGYYIIEMENCN